MLDHMCSGNGAISLFQCKARSHGFQLLGSGSKVTANQKASAIQDMMVYRDWFSECVMRGNTKTPSDAILIMPLGPCTIL